jgi:hypothetical protein
METIRKATKADKAQVLEILVEAFWNDPHINWFSGKGPKKAQRIKAMMSHAFEGALARGDVYLTENEQAVAIWRNSVNTGFSLISFWENLKFLYHFGFKKVKAITALEHSVKQRYPKDQPYYYLFIIGTSRSGRGKGLSSQLMNSMLEEADRKGIPTYLETANVDNLPIYRKKGFQPYGLMEVAGEDPISVHFLKRSPLVS